MAKQRKHGEAVRYGDGSVRERVRKDGGSSFNARWYDGLQWRSRTFGTMEGAEDFLRQRGRDMRSGRYVADEDVILTAAIDDYLRRGETRWRPITRANYGSIRDMIADTTLGSTRISEITPRQCQSWVDSLASTYGSHRIGVIRQVVSGALNEAMRLGLIHTNPMIGVRIPSPKRRVYTIWTIDDAQRALEAAADDPLLHPYYMLALFTGMRPGEMRALLWRDVDLDTGAITVGATMTRDANYASIRGDATKNGESRTVYVTPEVVAALKRHRARQNERRLAADAWHTAGYVFDRGNGVYLPQQTIHKRHKAFCVKHGLPECRLHDLRHFAGTMLLESGVDIKVVAETLGHRSDRTTREVYQHVSTKQRRDVADTLRELLTPERKAE